MKLYNIVYYILFISFICTSCDNDNIGPEIEVTSPIENITLDKSDQYTLEATITDDKELDYFEIMITGPDQSKFNKTVELEGTSQSISHELDLNYLVSGLIVIQLTAVDKAGNRISFTRNLQFNYFDSGSIDLNIKLKYDGDPLTLFESYTYPGGGDIDFTRCSFYISNMKLDDTMINEVEFHNLSNAHATNDLSMEGYTSTIDIVPVGTYGSLSFDLGVVPELNKKDPGEFPSGHPLAKPAENWFSWQSYIFLKIEGNIDLDGDGTNETGVALHLGSDEALRSFSFEYPIEVVKDGNAKINLIFDIYDLFNGDTRVYPIDENPQIHSLSQLDAVNELADNLTNVITK